ncbi:MAG: hypothetical protein JJT89_16660 [Nitriliruptoraceae bacterium]|nr:hypothetical protein [Nitriliruptoraceae bacterium]
MQRYPTDTLWDELTFLAFHLGWSLDDLLDLEHHDRRRLVARVAALDARQRVAPTGAPRPMPSPAFPATSNR